MKDNRKRQLLNPQKMLKCLISGTKGLRSLNIDTDLDCPGLNKENKLYFTQKLISLSFGIDLPQRHKYAEGGCNSGSQKLRCFELPASAADLCL